MLTQLVKNGDLHEFDPNSVSKQQTGAPTVPVSPVLSLTVYFFSHRRTCCAKRGMTNENDSSPSAEGASESSEVPGTILTLL